VLGEADRRPRIFLGWLTGFSSCRCDAGPRDARARRLGRDGRHPDAEEVPPVDDEYLIVILVLAILFGASRLPLLGRNFGQGIREFKKGIADAHDDVTHSDSDDQHQPQ
jgi:sec-independent protein translocase protein TatA